MQQYLWDGKNKHNSQVPVNTLGEGAGLTLTKKQAWNQEQDALEDMYQTTSKVGSFDTNWRGRKSARGFA